MIELKITMLRFSISFSWKSFFFFLQVIFNLNLTLWRTHIELQELRYSLLIWILAVLHKDGSCFFQRDILGRSCMNQWKQYPAKNTVNLSLFERGTTHISRYWLPIKCDIIFFILSSKKKFLEYPNENFFQKLWKYIYHFPQPSLDILDQNLAYISRDKPIRVRRPWAPPVKLGGKQADQYWYCGQEANSGQVHFWLHCSKYSWLSF